MTGSMRFVCDHLDCQSSVTITAKADLENHKKALVQRGWRCVRVDDTDRHYCLVHADRPTQSEEVTEAAPTE